MVTLPAKNGANMVLLIAVLLMVTACEQGLGGSSRKHVAPLPKNGALHVIMVGPPSVGKGTHSKMIAERYGIPHISTGDILRHEAESGSEQGQHIKHTMEQGGLVGPAILMELLSKRLDQSDCRHGYVLDGVPRSAYQAEIINARIRSNPGNVNLVLNMQADDQELMRRVRQRAICGKCNAAAKVDDICSQCRGDEIVRADDNITTFRERLRTYHRHSRPVLNYFTHYGNGTIIVNIDVMREIADVSKDINLAIDHFIMSANQQR